MEQSTQEVKMARRVIKGLVALIVSSALVLTAAASSATPAAAAHRRHQVVSMRADRTHVAIGDVVSWSGQLTPAVAGVTVKLQRRYVTKKRWVTVTKAVVTADGTWSASTKMSDSRDRYYRAYIPSRKGFSSDYSPKIRVTVAADVTRTETIPARVTYRNTDTLAVGVTHTEWEGADGLQRVTYRGGVAIKTVVLREPGETLILVGTRPKAPPTAWITACELQTSPTTGGTWAYVHAEVSDPDLYGYVVTLTADGRSKTFAPADGDNAYTAYFVGATAVQTCGVTLG